VHSNPIPTLFKHEGRGFDTSIFILAGLEHAASQITAEALQSLTSEQSFDAGTCTPPPRVVPVLPIIEEEEEEITSFQPHQAD